MFVGWMDLAHKSHQISFAQNLIFIGYIVDVTIIPVLRNTHPGGDEASTVFGSLPGHLFLGKFTDYCPGWFETVAQ